MSVIPQPGDDVAPGQLDQGDLAGYARLEPDRGAGRDVEPEAAGRRPVEGQRRVGLGEVVVRADLDGPVAGVLHGQRDPFPPRGQLDGPVRGDDLARDHRIGRCSVTSLVPSGNVASTWTESIISG